MPKICKCLRVVGAVVLAVACSSFPLFGQRSTTTCPFPAGNGNEPQHKVCVETQGDSATPKALHKPIDESNKSEVRIEVGPLSPIESCSLTSITSTPSTATNQGALAQLIAVLLGTTITPLATPAGPAGQRLTTQSVNEGGKLPAPAPGLDQISHDEKKATDDINAWIKRREDALDVLDEYQGVLTTDARMSEDAKHEVSTLADCLDEQAKTCRKGDKSVSYQDRIDLDKLLAKIDSEIAAAASLIKAPAASVCKGSGKKNETKEQKEADEKACVEKYQSKLQGYHSELTRLDEDKAELAELQDADKTLHAGDASLEAAFAQVERVALHVDPPTAPDRNIPTRPTMINADGRLFEDLTLRPSPDSDVTASVTCTSILDNSTTLGPVPLTIHTSSHSLVFSVGAVLSLTPHQTLGLVPVPDTSTAGYHNIVANTGLDHFQVIPFAFLTYLPPIWGSHLGFTGGVGFNPYSGVQGIDGFEGLSYRWEKIYFHVGIHDGRYEDLDPTSELTVGQTVSSGFPTTVPTRTRFTFHPAFGISYSF